MYQVRVLSPTYYLNNAKVRKIIISEQYKEKGWPQYYLNNLKEMDEQSKDKDKSIIVTGAHS